MPMVQSSLRDEFGSLDCRPSGALGDKTKSFCRRASEADDVDGGVAGDEVAAVVGEGEFVDSAMLDEGLMAVVLVPGRRNGRSRGIDTVVTLKPHISTRLARCWFDVDQLQI